MTEAAMRAVARATGAALILLVVVLGTDRLLKPADLSMALLAGLALIAAAAFAAHILLSLRRVPNDRQVARYVEEQCPELEDRLASATDVAGGSRSAFRDLMLSDAAARAREVNLDRVIAGRDIRRSVVRGVGAVAALLIMLALGMGSVGRIVRSAWLYAFPYAATLEVEPGDTRVITGETLHVRAKLTETFGVPARTLPVLIMVNGGGAKQVVEMRQERGVYHVEIPSVDESFTYRVRAATVVSDDFTVTALSVPHVERIDVTYRYPAFTGLEPRVETDSGDIYAPAGTEVALMVHADKPVRAGAIRLESGGSLELRRVGDRRLAVSFEVRHDDSYGVTLVDDDALTNPGDGEYFIRTVFDRTPDIEIRRPGGDREITLLEEVVVEARAADDYGIERFELVFSVVGRNEHAIDLQRGSREPIISGAHTIYAEDLGVSPGDFISYYARARDTNASRYARETRSDIFFLEVRPFDQEFEEARSQSLSAMDVGALGNLAKVQKEIIVATWKLDRQLAAERAVSDLTAVADVQAELRQTAQRVADRIIARGRESTPQTRGRRALEDEAMAKAVEAMGVAETALLAHDTQIAIPPEMEALNQLLTAQAEVRRKQVALQQGPRGAQLEADRAQEDLSELFDRELRRDQKTNYENRSSAAEAEAEKESDALRKVRELAERQEVLNRAQQELAKQAENLEAQEFERALERLTREQNVLRRNMEDLQRELHRIQQQGEVGQPVWGRTDEIADRMRRATSELRRRDLSQSARRGQEALERLRDLEQQVGGESSSGQHEALGQLQLEAQQLATAQRHVASETRQSDAGAAGRDARYRLAGQEDGLADRVEAFEGHIEELLPRTANKVQQALTGAREELNRSALSDRMRELADRLRRTASLDATEDSQQEVARIADADDEVASILEQVTEHLRSASPRNAVNQRLSQELQEAQELRRSLNQITQQLRQMAEASSNQSTEDVDSPTAQDSRGGGAVVEPGADLQLSLDGRPTPHQTKGGMAGHGELSELQAELMRQFQKLPELLERLRREHPMVEQGLENLARHWFSGAAPGTEAFKQDYAAWESLRDDVQLALEQFEAARSRELTQQETDGRLNIGPSDRVPETYRRLVEQYYRSLATRRGEP